MQINPMTFAVWAMSQPRLSAAAIMARFTVSRATAYRWRAEFFEARMRVAPWG